MLLASPIVIGDKLDSKSGVAIPGDFSGTPKKATISFSTAYPTAAYSVTFAVIAINKSYAPSAESKTASGFVINLNSNTLSGLAEIGWQTSEVGE